MTASTLTQLPLMAGGILLGQIGRAGQWTFSRYMRAPLASTGILAMVTLTAFAGSNALYFQTADHPSPFFAPSSAASAMVAAPMVAEPAPAPELVETVPTTPESVPEIAAAPETTGTVAPVIPDTPVGNTQMFEVQRRLFELQLFTGTVDGYYGPRTAAAIRAFEQQNGLPVTGSTDSAVLDAILRSDANGRITQPVAPQPEASVSQPVSPQPAAPQVDQVVARLPPLSPAEQVLDDVATTAHNTIDSIIGGIDTARSPATTAYTAPAPVPAANVALAQPQPMPQPVQAQPAQQVASVAPVQQPQAQPAPVAAQASTAANATRVPPANDTELVMQIQRGLASLGFYRAQIDGRPSAETSRAIREFENFYRYRMTGQVQPDLVDLLLRAGATI